MKTCDMCGAKNASYIIVVEGSHMQTCRSCTRHGKVIEKPKPHARQHTQNIPREPVTEEEKQQFVVANYGQRIRKKREQLNLTQKEFAKQLQLKESLLQKIETNTFEPDVTLARKLEKLLGISLIEILTVTSSAPSRKERSDGLTIGDMINLKRKKI